ncbi:SMP-30/gluconolactonase/LRE family protein [Micromonospora sp. LOL_021]|uniref:SMP-30/gluconolactonase/LRE family protein n=1 Tax=Micromonospora sp. LOL_021 TaxID=3345417 RepID=UPI003A8A1DB3
MTAAPVERTHVEYDVLDPSFRRLVAPDATLDRLYSGMTWAEGPTFFADSGAVVFSDVPGNRMYRWSADGTVAVHRSPSRFGNGNAVDRSGRLYTCEQGTRSIVIEQDGRVDRLVDSYQGRRLNSPNDVIVDSRGRVWFSDPTYGIDSDEQGYRAPSELDGNYVFRFDPASSQLSVIVDDMVMPNGLALSPDERTLYVSDSAVTNDPAGPHHLRAYDLSDDGAATNGRTLFEVDPGWPDGFKADDAGLIWCSAGDGVQIHDASGRKLGTIRIPETVANLCFGSRRGRPTLFVTATSSLYAIDLPSR